MLHLRPLTTPALAANHWLLPQERARLAWHLHTPYAMATEALLGTTPAGAAGLVLAGSCAVVDLLAVDEAHLGRGVGRALLHHLLQQATQAACTTQLVNAPRDVRHFYRRHGFVAQAELLRCSGGTYVEATHDAVVPLHAGHTMALLHLDARATGLQRSSWLLEHGYLGRAYVDGGRVRGFALPLLRDGLIVADAPAVGLELQRWVLPTQESLLLPAHNTAALAHLAGRGYHTTLEAVRMVRGAPLPWNAEWVYGYA